MQDFSILFDFLFKKERAQKIPIKNRNLPLSGKLRIFYKKTNFLIKTND